MYGKKHDFSENKRAIFSVIIPCYNSESYIDRCIQSCLNSTFSEFELVIINDGSTDNTLSILENYAKKDTRIRIYSKENGGYVSAVNYGLEYIQGEYFMFLGSDDEITANLFYDINEQIKNTEKPDIIGFNAIINKNQVLTRDKNSDFDTLVRGNHTTIKEFSIEYPEHSKIFFTRDTSKMFKTDILGNVRYLGKSGMDADGIFSMSLAHNAKSFLCVPTVGYVWYLRDESLSGRKKDYKTQIDRIDNWIAFGEKIMKMEPELVTGQEKYYLTNYFYAIVKATFFSYVFRCLLDDTIRKAGLFLVDACVFFDYERPPKEFSLLINHKFLWGCYVFVKTFFEKLRKRMKK